MSFKIREGLGGIISFNGIESSNTNNSYSIGKVFGVITTENTPNKELFEEYGGWDGIGTIFYLPYEQSKNLEIKDINLATCKTAKPYFSNIQDYPLLYELILLVDSPSPASQVRKSKSKKYYLGTVNLWNNNQQNIPAGEKLGETFTENKNIRRLVSFEGDRIYQGRKNNGIRFGSTVSARSNINEWSSIGNNGDPITILVNGYTTTNTGSLTPNIEGINKDMSSIWMTSTQKIPLIPGASIINPILSTLSPNNYINSQIILNSDRVILNSKKDEVLLFAKTNIGLNTDNNIILNAGQNVHINIESKNPESKILLGTKPDNTVPDEPVLLGGQTHDLLLEICRTLNRLAYYLSTASVPTSDGSICISACNDAGSQLFSDVNKLIDKLGTIQSNKVFTV